MSVVVDLDSLLTELLNFFLDLAVDCIALKINMPYKEVQKFSMSVLKSLFQHPVSFLLYVGMVDDAVREALFRLRYHESIPVFIVQSIYLQVERLLPTLYINACRNFMDSCRFSLNEIASIREEYRRLVSSKMDELRDLLSRYFEVIDDAQPGRAEGETGEPSC